MARNLISSGSMEDFHAAQDASAGAAPPPAHDETKIIGTPNSNVQGPVIPPYKTANPAEQGLKGAMAAGDSGAGDSGASGPDDLYDTSEKKTDMGTTINNEPVTDNMLSYNREHSGNTIISPQSDSTLNEMKARESAGLENPPSNENSGAGSSYQSKRPK